MRPPRRLQHVVVGHSIRDPYEQVVGITSDGAPTAPSDIVHNLGWLSPSLREIASEQNLVKWPRALEVGDGFAERQKVTVRVGQYRDPQQAEQ